MRVRDLRTALEDIKSLLGAAGAASQEKDLDKVAKLLAAQDNRDLNDCLADVHAALTPTTPKPVVSADDYIARLANADFDESSFRVVVDELRRDQTMKREQLEVIAKGYGVIRLVARSKATLIDSIEKHFFWRLYNRDANEMAKRATPW